LDQASVLMVGPGIGLAISAFFGYPGLFLAAAGTAVASLVCVAAVPKDLRTDPRVSQAHLSQRQSTWSATAIPSVAQFAVSVAYGTIVSFVAVVARDRALTAVGAFFVLFALSGLGSRLVAGRVYDIWGVAAALTPTFLSLTIGMGLLAAARDHTLSMLGTPSRYRRGAYSTGHPGGQSGGLRVPVP